MPSTSLGHSGRTPLKEYGAVFVVLLIFLGALYLRRRWSRATASDFRAIRAYAQSRNLQILEIVQSGNHWRYWLRGNLLLSNVARIFVVTVENPGGQRRKLHVAFDPIGGSRELKLLQEKPVSKE